MEDAVLHDPRPGGEFSGIAWEKGELWKTWWNEWSDKSGTLKNGELPKDPEKEYSKLCVVGEKLIIECKQVYKKRQACVGVRSGKISSCTNFNGTDIAIPVCKEDFSSKIISCGTYKPAYLCYPQWIFQLSHRPIKPCRYEHRQVCLRNGFPRRCQKLGQKEKHLQLAFDHKHKSKSDVVLRGSLVDPMEKSRDALYDKSSSSIDRNLGTHNRETIKHFLEDPAYLCTSQSDKNIYVHCFRNGSQVCFGKGSGALKECSSFAVNDIPLKVCFDETSKGILICPKNSPEPDFLCFGHRLIKPFRKCESRKNGACLSSNGTIEECKKNSQTTSETFFHHTKKPRSNYREKPNSDYKTSGKVHAEENKHISAVMSSLKNLCKLESEGSKFVLCEDDPHRRFACFGSRSGHVEGCNNFTKNDPKIPICFQVQSNNLMTCDIVSNERLCFLQPGNSNKVGRCNYTKRFACYENGILTKCSEMQPSSNIHETIPSETGRNDYIETSEYFHLRRAPFLPTVSKHIRDGYSNHGEHEHMSLNKNSKNGKKWSKLSINADPLSPTDKKNSRDCESGEKNSIGSYPDSGVSVNNESGEKYSSEDESYDHSAEDDRDDNYKLEVQSEEVSKEEHPVDEKFFRVNCHDCSLDSKFIIDGTPDDVLPEVQVFTFPKEM